MSSEDATPDLVKGRILIVDDDDDLAAAMSESLADDGYKVHRAIDGADGIKTLRKHPFDAVLLDLKMPNVDGEGVMAWLKDDAVVLESLVVIVVSANLDSTQIVKMLDYGAVDYITKPFDMEVLKARVAAAIRAKRRRDELIQQEAHIEGIKRDIESTFDTLRDASAVIDRNFQILRVNQASLAMHGYKTYAELLGRNCYEAFYGRDKVCENCPALETFTSGVYAERELPIPHGDGTKYHRVGTVPVRSGPDDEELGRILEVTEDVTEVRKLRDQMLQQQKIEAIAHLAGASSHEINQPLGAIRGRAQLLLMNLEGKLEGQDDLRAELNEILACTDQIDKIVTKLHGITDYVTKPYVNGTEILDIDKSSGSEAPEEGD